MQFVWCEVYSSYYHSLLNTPLSAIWKVVLSRELERCPTFRNLKTLSLGEWCMAADFDALIFLLQHSPNIERLFLQLTLVCKYMLHATWFLILFVVFSISAQCLITFRDMQKNFNTRNALKTSIKPMGRSFTCKELRMVKIKCSKDDARVHTLAHMFRANGVPLKKIYVRRSGNACE
jgi:hypothetical protein